MKRLMTRTDFIIWKQRDGRYIFFSLRYGSRNYIIDIVLVVRERVVLNLPRMILSLVISLVNQHTKIKLLNGVGQIERLRIQ